MAPKSSYSDILKGVRATRASTPPPPVAPAATPAEPVVECPRPSSTPTPPPPAPPGLSSYPPLPGQPSVSSAGTRARAVKPQPRRSWASAAKGSRSPPSLPAVIATAATAKNETATPEPTPAEAMPSVQDGEKQDLRASPKPPEAPTARTSSASADPNVLSLWFEPDGADVLIRCRGKQWAVHRDVLVDMSEWMEKYLPPAAKDGKPIVWNLDTWDPAMLGTVLQYMYLEDYPGGDYNPKKPLDTRPVRHAVAHFLSGTSCLCRPMMDRALNQLDAATEVIQKLVPTLRHANLDTFEFDLRVSMLIMYDQPDQWRIRSLRIVMGKLMAVCFPLILQSRRWESVYELLWGILRIRVVADHKWLSQAGQCPRSDVILAGFEHMVPLWVKYRGTNWQPNDDRMFPQDEVVNLPALPAASNPPTPAGVKKKSKAIPIKRPDGTIAPCPGKTGPCEHDEKHSTDPVEPKPQPSRSKVENRPTDYPHPVVEPKLQLSGKGGKAPETAVEDGPSNTAKPATIDPSPTMVQTSPTVDDPFTTGLNGSIAPLMPNARAAPGSVTHTSQRPYPFLPPPYRPQSWPGSPQKMSVQPWPAASIFPVDGVMPGGHHFFRETSTGEPSDYTPSEAGGTSAASSAIDPVDSPDRRMTELGTEASPRPESPIKSMGKGIRGADGQSKAGATSFVQADVDETPRAGRPSRPKSTQEITPTAVPSHKGKGKGKKKA